MATVASILGDIATLSTSEKEKLRTQLVSVFAKHLGTLDEFVTEERFSAGIVCPYCGERHISRNGHRKDGTQRYVCMDCGRTFVATTNTITAGTRKDLSTWEKYIDCLMNGFSLRKSADICKMHRNTAFTWRHKILEALQIMAKAVTFDGIIEADETFFTKSYKGNHNKGSFIMPRISHKRGNSTHTKGLSREKVCVPCAVNRNGLSIATASNLFQSQLLCIITSLFSFVFVFFSFFHFGYQLFLIRRIVCCFNSIIHSAISKQPTIEAVYPCCCICFPSFFNTFTEVAHSSNPPFQILCLKIILFFQSFHLFSGIILYMI